MILNSTFASTVRWTEKMHLPCQSFATLESTNTLAKQQAFASTDKLVLYLADVQTAGRGRGQNQWSDSGQGQSLAISFKFLLDEAPQPLMPALAGLATYGAAAHAFPSLSLSLKPPNDLYLEDKKLAGLLVETVAKGDQFCLIFGLGMNVLSAPESVPTATALCSPLGFARPIEEVVWFEFLTKLKTLLERYIPLGCRAQLPPLERATLLQALNAFPKKPAQYMDLTSDCQLITEHGTVSWKDL